MLNAKEMMERKNVISTSRQLVSVVAEKVTRISIGYPYTDKVYIDNLDKLVPEDVSYLKSQHHIIINAEKGYAAFDEDFASQFKLEVDGVIAAIDELFEVYQARYIKNIISEFHFKLDVSTRRDELVGGIPHLYDYFESAGFRVDLDKNILNITIAAAEVK